MSSPFPPLAGPAPGPGSVPVAPGICSLDQECHLLRLLAETFAYELERERQVRLEGGPSLPQEWVTYLQRERQDILDKIRQIEHASGEYIPSSNKFLAEYAIPAVNPPVLRTVPPTPALVPHTTDIKLHNSRSLTRQSITGNESASRSNISTNNINVPSPSEQTYFFERTALREIEANNFL
jgi:hypothetical protein